MCFAKGQQYKTWESGALPNGRTAALDQTSRGWLINAAQLTFPISRTVKVDYSH